MDSNTKLERVKELDKIRIPGFKRYENIITDMYRTSSISIS